jgi:hypothetical protein
MHTTHQTAHVSALVQCVGAPKPSQATRCLEVTFAERVLFTMYAYPSAARSRMRECAAEYAYIALKNALADAQLKESDYQNNGRFASILGQGGTSLQDVVETADAVRSQVLEV